MGKDKGSLASYRKELDTLKLGRKKAPIAIDRSGRPLGGAQIDEKMSEKDYKIARMMASLSPEERVEL